MVVNLTPKPTLVTATLSPTIFYLDLYLLEEANSGALLEYY
jgi:hypothetical protein